MAREKDLIDFLKDANDVVKLLTGKSIPDLARRSAELFGESVAKRILEEETLEPDSPYAVLGIRPDAATVVVKATYRAAVRNLSRHSEEYRKIHDAYMQILAERGEG